MDPNHTKFISQNTTLTNYNSKEDQYIGKDISKLAINTQTQQNFLLNAINIQNMNNSFVNSNAKSINNYKF